MFKQLFKIMKRKIYFSAALALLCCVSVTAQPRAAGEPQLLLKAATGLMSPVWSPDGSQIAVTGDNYAGIWVANADGSNLNCITTENGAGYKMIWNADGKSVTARTYQVEKQRRMYSVKQINVATKAETTIVGATRNISGTPTLKNVKAAKLAAATAYETMVNDPVNATSKISGLAEFAGKMILNPALSPDGKKIAFQVPGNGAFVSDMNGDNAKSIGRGAYPSWMPDSRYLIVARGTDNGANYTASDLYCIDTVSGEATLLTENTDLIPMTHAVSPDGTKVAFENCADGCIYLLNLK